MAQRRNVVARRGTVAVVALVAAAASMVPSPGGASSPKVRPVSRVTVVAVSKLLPTTFKGHGPYAVGETTFTVSVPSMGYTTSVEVWYPAKATTAKQGSYNLGLWFPEPLLGLLKANPAVLAKGVSKSGGVRNAVPSKGTFPLVLFSHGWAGIRDQSSFLTAHLASWGFVVAAPDHPSRNLTEVIGTYVGIAPPTTDPQADVADLLATVEYLKTMSSGLLRGHVDASRFAVIGHSAGAVAAEELSSYDTFRTKASGVANPDVGFIALAGASTAGLPLGLTAPFDTLPSEPSIFVAAQNDNVVPGVFMRATYNVQKAPHRFINLASSGHLVFTDTCATAPGEGVLVTLFKGLKIALPANFVANAGDGCKSPNVAVTKQWPVINQLTVAGVRVMFGIDKSNSALSNFQSAYGSLVSVDTTGVAK